MTNGVASLSTTALTVGDNTITAKYTPALGITPIPSGAVRPTREPRRDDYCGDLHVDNDRGVRPEVLVGRDPDASGAKFRQPDRDSLVHQPRNQCHGFEVTCVRTRATLPTSSLTLGTNTFLVQYAGSANYTPSTTSITRTVVKATSRTTLVWSPHGTVAGSPVTFTATQKCVAPCTIVPTGTIVFTDGATTISGAISLNASGVATFVTSGLAKGTHSITATYSGNGASCRVRKP